MTAGAPQYFNARARFHRACLAPALIVLCLVTCAPLAYLVVSSLTPLSLTDPGGTWRFDRPARNYMLLMQDQRFLNSLWVQFKLSLFGVGLQVTLGVGLALALNRNSAVVESLRSVFLIPMVLPPIVVAIIWKILYTPEISPIYQALLSLGYRAPAMGASVSLALWAIIIADTWQWLPFAMLMTLAALQMMPEEYLEAARLDGASGSQILRFITLPYLRETIIIAALFRLVDSIKAFPLIYILTDGGPGSATEVTNYYSYIQAFNFSFLGYSSAITVVLVTLVTIFSAVMFYATRRDRGYA